MAKFGRGGSRKRKTRAAAWNKQWESPLRQSSRAEDFDGDRRGDIVSVPARGVDGKQEVFRRGSFDVQKTLGTKKESKSQPIYRYTNLARNFERVCVNFNTLGTRLATESGQRISLSRYVRSDQINVAFKGKNLGYINSEGRALWFPGGRDHAIEAAISKFNDDPYAAIRDYGIFTGECWVCKRKLTNPESIARGIGPICEKRLNF